MMKSKINKQVLAEITVSDQVLNLISLQKIERSRAADAIINVRLILGSKKKTLFRQSGRLVIRINWSIHHRNPVGGVNNNTPDNDSGSVIFLIARDYR